MTQWTCKLNIQLERCISNGKNIQINIYCFCYFSLFIICLVVCAQNVCRQIENVKKYCIFQFLSITTINVETRYNVVFDQQRVTLVILLSSGVTIILRLTDKRHYNGGHNHSISHNIARTFQHKPAMSHHYPHTARIRNIKDWVQNHWLWSLASTCSDGLWMGSFYDFYSKPNMRLISLVEISRLWRHYYAITMLMLQARLYHPIHHHLFLSCHALNSFHQITPI